MKTLQEFVNEEMQNAKYFYTDCTVRNNTIDGEGLGNVISGIKKYSIEVDDDEEEDPKYFKFGEIGNKELKLEYVSSVPTSFDLDDETVELLKKSGDLKIDFDGILSKCTKCVVMNSKDEKETIIQFKK